MVLPVLQSRIALLAAFTLLTPLASLTPLAAPTDLDALTSFPSPGCTLQYGQPMYIGSGCPQGSVQALPQGNNVLIRFQAFGATAGEGYLESESFKACDIQIDVTFPSGCFYTGAFTLERRGRSSLDPGVSARMEFDVTMSGTNQHWPARSEQLNGPTPNIDGTSYYRKDGGKGPAELWWSLRNGGTGTMKFKAEIVVTRSQYGVMGWHTLDTLEMKMN